MIQITDKHDCCGCAACANACPQACITLRPDGEGFLYPAADPERCVECGLCEQVCPFLTPREARLPVATYAAVNPDAQERLDSSSGGIFSLLMRATLEAGGVVFGAAFDADWNVGHIAVESLEDMPRLRGSKYVQSATGESFRMAEEYLKQGRKVLFSGTPCQIAGLNHYLGKEYDKLLRVDVVCHGVPSPQIWKAYLEGLGDLSGIRSVCFRDKRSGWLDYAFSIGYEDGRTLRESHHANLFMQGFLHDLYVRPSCHRCKAKGGRCGSDITLGDFWGIGAVLPDWDDDRGVSLVLADTGKGDAALKAVTDGLAPVPCERAVRGNPFLGDSAPEPAWRKVFWSHYGRGEGLQAGVEAALRARRSSVRRIWGKIKGLLTGKK